MSRIELATPVELKETAEAIRGEAAGCYGSDFTAALADFMESATDHEPWPNHGPHKFYCRRCGFSDDVCNVWMNVSLMVQAYKTREQGTSDAASPDHRD